MGKKPEMSQVYNDSKNEFIFGEGGGKGKHLSSFLKNLSLTGSSAKNTEPILSPYQHVVASQSGTDFKEVNSSIYGSLSYNKESGVGGGSMFSAIERVALVTSQNTQPERKTSPFGKRISSSHKARYDDLDDDWDAGLDEVLAKKLENKKLTKVNPVTLTLGDIFHPDLSPISVQPGSGPSMAYVDYEDQKAKAELNKLNLLNSKYTKFQKVLSDPNAINIQDLRKLSWNGVPTELRAITWQILLGYLPANVTRQELTLHRKRQEYLEGIEVAAVDFSDDKTSFSGGSESEKQLYHQINIDVKRTHPAIKLYATKETQTSLRKILYLWAVRHPASGYVQGINDLCTPFYQLFLGNYIWQLQKLQKAGEVADERRLLIPGLHDSSDQQELALLADLKLQEYTIDNLDPSKLSQRVHDIIEADTYWCLSRLLENITDNYIHEQPGILRQVQDLKNLVGRIDSDLLSHFEREGIEFIQFSFRWMNCLLMRELSIELIVRMWDTYLSETPLGFNTFHVYVCAAFLSKFSAELKEKDFQEILLFLQNPPTNKWTDKDVELILSEAFIWQSLYKNASAHLR